VWKKGARRKKENPSPFTSEQTCAPTSDNALDKVNSSLGCCICVSFCCAPDAFFTRFFEQVLKMWDTQQRTASSTFLGVSSCFYAMHVEHTQDVNSYVCVFFKTKSQEGDYVVSALCFQRSLK
jgi:hypothetical protein